MKVGQFVRLKEPEMGYVAAVTEEWIKVRWQSGRTSFIPIKVADELLEECTR